MTGKTHIMAGITATTVVAAISGEYEAEWLIAAGAVGGLIPDICHSGSKIGRRFPLVSKLVNTIFGHRTFTHSLLFLALMALILSKAVSNPSITMGILIGMATHLLLDAATKQGIKLLYPSKITVRFPVTTKTGGKAENILLLIMTGITLYFANDIVGLF
ncbi:metal-dependent hydrolase [Gracilibacillus alcaliphilus]|uniref:metal-dependent hydrolase n=1 Tax=Gracilibacillus alcaliphilus TaxID=1401441 RepID=UPI00195C6666|nr:metal-dependent hydrolase [Gracilibacillus alcaliphilus]MBM7676578.1 inner membrane protein [Gracilibacillus alcaliphilus]